MTKNRWLVSRNESPVGLWRKADTDVMGLIIIIIIVNSYTRELRLRGDDSMLSSKTGMCLDP
jgi:hypothetical protein